jgi:EAL domain-containing protein (putative c-di-GMP-specific phosphodiesterase class I)
MVEAIHRIGHQMGLKTVAEYVESDQILALLRQIGVDYVQGSGVHQPEPLETLCR